VQVERALLVILDRASAVSVRRLHAVREDPVA
jgi:hypothetical protein